MKRVMLNIRQFASSHFSIKMIYKKLYVTFIILMNLFAFIILLLTVLFEYVKRWNWINAWNDCEINARVHGNLFQNPIHYFNFLSIFIHTHCYLNLSNTIKPFIPTELRISKLNCFLIRKSSFLTYWYSPVSLFGSLTFSFLPLTLLLQTIF